MQDKNENGKNEAVQMEMLSEQPTEKPTEQASGKTSEQAPEQPSEQAPGESPEQAPEQPSEQAPGESPEQAPEQPSEQLSEQVSEESSEQAPEQPSEQIQEGPSVQAPGQPTEQASEELSEQPSEPVDYRWFVPLNRSSLTAVLAGGVIAPHKSYADYEEDIQQFAGDGVLLVRGGVSSGLLEAGGIEEGAANMMLAEIRFDGFPGGRVRGLNGKGEVCGTTPMERDNNIYVLSFPAIIPATRIVAVHFKSEVEKKNYMVRGFDNAPLDVVPMEVSARLFQQDVPGAVIENLGNISFDDSDTSLDALYREADSLTGGAALMVAAFPSKENWMHLLEYVLKGGRICDVPYGITNEVVRHKLEQTLFNEAFSMMLEMDPEQGWQAKKVLSDLHTKVGSESLSKNDGVQLSRWSDACADILDNKKEVTPLGDDRMEVGRALLLLLLRPDPQDIIGSRDSSLKPGMEVRCLAAILSGTRCGLEGLSNDTKSVASRYGLFAGLKAHLMNSGWKKSVLHEHIDIPEVDIQSNEWGPMGTQYKVLVDGKELLEWKDEGPLALTHVRAAAAEAGIKLKYERAMNRLSYRRDLGEGRKQFVYIIAGAPNAKGENTIRIWSPCLDFSKPKGKRLLTQKMQVKLLGMNSEPDLYCRFARSDSEKMIIVISDQILRTMDEPELLAALEHVALTADNFEKEIGLDIF